MLQNTKKLTYVSSIPSELLIEKEVNIISSVLIANINLSRSTCIIVYKNQCLDQNKFPKAFLCRLSKPVLWPCYFDLI